ncbi:RNA-binding protein [Candidatus Gracilibacteria bacterium]|nr:RNA-binding protein [Candidatus Gracilibacteria bacterium]
MENLGTPTNKLFIGNLAWTVRGVSLRDAFSEFGAVYGKVALENGSKGKSRGFGFVEFETVEAATAALEAMQGKEVEGREIRIMYAQEQERRENTEEAA